MTLLIGWTIFKPSLMKRILHLRALNVLRINLNLNMTKTCSELKSKIALRAKITAHISHSAVEGKGKCKVSCHLARDTQTNLIHKQVNLQWCHSQLGCFLLFVCLHFFFFFFLGLPFFKKKFGHLPFLFQVIFHFFEVVILVFQIKIRSSSIFIFLLRLSSIFIFFLRSSSIFFEVVFLVGSK